MSGRPGAHGLSPNTSERALRLPTGDLRNGAMRLLLPPPSFIELLEHPLRVNHSGEFNFSDDARYLFEVHCLGGVALFTHT